MDLVAHGVHDVRVKETLHNNFSVKKITFLDGDNGITTIKLFGRREELDFIHEDILDTRKNN